MRSVYSGKKSWTTKEIHSLVMGMKGELDTIIEEKDLDQAHDLHIASNHLNSFLDAIEEQAKSVSEEDND